MRGTRWLVLVALVAILTGVGLTYRMQRKTLREAAPAKPPPLSVDLNSSAEHWEYHVTDGGREVAFIEAESVAQVKDSSRIDLKNVTLRLHNRDDETFNLVKSAAASFATADQSLYSEGAVQITLRVPLVGQPAHTLVSIQSSGVRFDTVSGRAETDRPSSFTFEHGDGSSTGASYDPTMHELILRNDAELHWQPVGPNAKPMKIQAATLKYHEDTQEVWLTPWGRLTRENTVVEGESVVVHLENQAIRKVEAVRAHGQDDYPNRKLNYAAGTLVVDYDDDGLVRSIVGTDGARLVSTGETSETTVTAGRVDLGLVPLNGESTLASVLGSGNTVVTSKPLPAPGRQPSETDILRSDKVNMKMRPGGREIESLVTGAPGTLEFVPNLPVQHHRTLDARQMTIAYGAQNRIDSFRATDARTRTEPTPDERKNNRTVATTSSRELAARFDPKTSQLQSMEQAGDFQYVEGDRQARAAKATLDSGTNLMLLDTGARMWDSTGSTTADRIRMDQRTGDFSAEGGVKSSRLPDKDQNKNSGMLSGDEPVEAQARRMESSNRNRRLHYEGGAVMWQGANRIQADVIDVDREKRTLSAGPNVVTSLWEDPNSKDTKSQDSKSADRKPADQKSTAAPVLTVVHAARLVYTDENRLAHYTGGVKLTRPGLDEKGDDLRAFLAESGADSRLEKAFADGSVEIVQTAPDRKRTGTGNYSEYYTADQKVILRGAKAKLVDTRDGNTEGTELTYFANDDRLLVNGAPRDPGNSRIARKHK
jgi:lipopolysaccharide export system protein LptA